MRLIFTTCLQSWLTFSTLITLPLTMLYDVVGTVDLAIFVCLIFVRNWKILLCTLQTLDIRPIFGLARGVLVAVLLVQAGKYWNYLSNHSPLIEAPQDWGPKPLFFPSRTSHTRFFPEVHSFSYSYLLTGIPIGWKGSVGGMLAADGSAQVLRNGVKKAGRSWYSVSAEDYLDRGYGHLGLSGKLKKFLESQDTNADEYPFAYLMTAPKFLGYSFNPVSFWYLYSVNRELTAMILEVNNTFDERRMYFLKPGKGPEEEDSSAVDILVPFNVSDAFEVSETCGKPTRFTQSWAKDFHVSPFNSRKGSYSLVAYDPLFPSMTGRGPVNNTITLKSSKAHSKLVARIYSEGSALNPEVMSFCQKIIFLASWWWVGFVTFPRIVREASKLFFRRNLHVWFRPEPLKDSMSRQADHMEQQLEASFKNYLRYLVETSPTSLIVKYTAAGISKDPETMMSSLADEDPSKVHRLHFKVLSPVFYTRFVRYAHDSEAFFSEFNDSGTIWLSVPSLLPDLIIKRPRPPQEIPDWGNFVFLKLIQRLRKRPLPMEKVKVYPNEKNDKAVVKKSDIRSFRISAMDGFIMAESNSVEQKMYRQQVLKLFICDRIAWGNTVVFAAELLFARCILAWVVAGSLGPHLIMLLGSLSK